jgi:hypothetical protein
MKCPKVAIIIINYFSIYDTKVCLKSINKQKYRNFVIYVVDNGSYPGEFEQLKKEYQSKKYKWISPRTNIGYAMANNLVLKRIRTKYAVLLNNDTVVDRLWLSELVKQAENNSNVAVIQPKIRSYYHRRFFDYAGGAGGYIDCLGYPYARGRVGFMLEEDIGQYDSPEQLMWASGTAMLIRMKVLKRVGYMYEQYFFYHEETDLCWRIVSSGLEIRFCPKACVYHKGAASSQKHLFRRMYFVHRNSLMLITRNMNILSLIWVLPLRVILDYLAVIYYILRRRYAYGLAVFFAHAGFIMLFPRVALSRKQISVADDANKPLLKPWSIYLNYFFLRRYRYSSIYPSSSMAKRKSRVIPYLIKSKNHRG